MTSTLSSAGGHRRLKIARRQRGERAAQQVPPERLGVPGRRAASTAPSSSVRRLGYPRPVVWRTWLSTGMRIGDISPLSGRACDRQATLRVLAGVLVAV